MHYKTVDDALKIWSGLTALVGVITGAFVSYFFTRGTAQAAQQATQVAQQSAQNSQQTAQQAQQAARDAQEKADAKDKALTATLGLITDDNLLQQVRNEPAVAAALRPS